MSLVGLLIFVIIFGLVFYLVKMLLDALPIAQPFKTQAARQFDLDRLAKIAGFQGFQISNNVLNFSLGK